MNTLTEHLIIFFIIGILPILIPLMFSIFISQKMGEKEIARIGVLFVVKEILFWLYRPILGFAETPLSLNLSWSPLYIYILLTFGLVFYVRKSFGITRFFWAFLIMDILFFAPTIIWSDALGFIKLRNEILYYDLMLGKTGNFMDHLLFLAPTLFTIIVYGVLLLSSKKQNQHPVLNEMG